MWVVVTREQCHLQWHATYMHTHTTLGKNDRRRKIMAILGWDWHLLLSPPAPSHPPPPQKKKEEKNSKKVRLEVEQVEIDKTEFPPPPPHTKNINKKFKKKTKQKKRMTTRKTTTKSKQKTAPPPTEQILDSPGCFFAPFSLFVLFCVLCRFKLRTGELIVKFPLSALQGEDLAGDE